MKQFAILLSVLLLILCAIINASAQDIITMKSGDEIKAHVTSVTKWEVVYLREGTQSPTYTILKSDIFMIKYPDGTKDVFTTTTVTPQQPETNNPKPETDYEDNHTERRYTQTSFVSFRAGGAIPGIKFNDQYVIPGFVLSLDANFLFTNKSHLGIAVMGHYTHNEFNYARFRNEASATDPENDYRVYRYDSYSSSDFISGLYATCSADWFSFDARIGCGISYSHLPSSLLTVTDYYGNSALYGFTSANAEAFVSDAGFDIRANIMKTVCVNVGFDYTYSNPLFTSTVKVYDYDWQGNLIEGQPEKVKLQLHEDIFLLTAGVGFCF